MPRKSISFELDFMTKDILPKFTVKQFDDISFNIKPKNQGLDYNTAGMTGKIFIGINNDVFMQTTGITVSSNNINVLLDKNMLQKNGKAYAEIELTDSNGTISSSSFIFNIDPKIGEGGMIPGEYEGFVEKYERLISEFKTQVNSTINNCNTQVNSTINNCNASVNNKLNTVDSFVDTKISELENRFNALTSKQQQDAEVIDARDGETSLKARLDRDIEKAKQVYVNVEGSYISTDSSSGYLKDVEILGNTIQDIENLADIRSVGEKVEGQELYEIPVLSRGKNLFDISKLKNNSLSDTNGEHVADTNYYSCNEFIKIKPNTTYLLSNNKTLKGKFYYYDSLKRYISNVLVANKEVSPANAYYLKFRVGSADYSTTLQLEEGTVATPYEPYQEDKITILSPTPLEKVGDVADRIIEKDGVWGVEKNIGNMLFNGSESGWSIKNQPLTSTTRFGIQLEGIDYASGYISNIFLPKLDSSQYTTDEEGISISSLNLLCFRVLKSKLPSDDLSGGKNWLSQNNLLVKYVLAKPTFIPLPHSQQVKLRTFANKTNISFLTEIEGTIKAQVPKSLGATVNTHTTQISNLNKELDRVKKLEESTVSTVTTESDFTTVEATSNGYFEDVKLEGKTLVNLLPNTVTGEASDYSNLFLLPNTITKSNTYTLIPFNLKHTNNIKLTISSTSSGENTFVSNIAPTNGVFVFKCANQEFNYDREVRIRLYVDNTVDSNTKYIILEGDHTQNPPSFFEGLKSVGQGTDEINVSSCNKGNLFNGKLKYGVISNSNGKPTDTTNTNRFYSEYYIPVYKNSKLVVSKNNLATNINFHKYSKNKTHMSSVFKDDGKLEIDFNGYIRIHGAIDSNETIDNIKVKVELGEVISNIDTPHQSDKKRLLFYNEETQTWEKPILREWDSIEKHSDGKYYYHQRSGEVVLNGSENWVYNSGQDTDNTFRYNLQTDIGCTTVRGNIMCDKLSVNLNIFQLTDDKEGICNYSNGLIFIRILKSKLSTQDAQGFKQWLQTNNVTVVYQLAEEKVYECTNIDLITYTNETNYIVESGIIVPKTTLKVHNNISNVVSLLQKKVSLLESNITNYMITQNRMQLASTYSADSVTFKVDYALCSEEVEYNEDLYNLILNNILVGKDNYNYDKMFNIILDYASWNQISWEQFDILVGLMDMQHNPPIEETPTDDEIVEEIPNEIM